ncbi:hypothetical protein B0T19DRAFT_472152 [Cercophora scortea]|uniref:CCHC-type domain-containing protein n=1 Tax=Cercophora scortea TaxID=314031 RepID=A0AAE0J595_9PEZI|nr:hypothetical protein B0T19DRAFT_472152 [Cercophora scortea]
MPPTSTGTHPGPMDVNAVTRGKERQSGRKPIKYFRYGKEGHAFRDCKGKARDGWQETPTGRQVSQVSKKVDHDRLSWTACYDDNCLSHKSDKEGTYVESDSEDSDVHPTRDQEPGP